MRALLKMSLSLSASCAHIIIPLSLRPDLPFKLDLGDFVLASPQVRLLPIRCQGKAVLPSPCMQFGGIVEGAGGSASTGWSRYVLLLNSHGVYLVKMEEAQRVLVQPKGSAGLGASLSVDASR